ncbi:P-loop containing nucleoside triphosphate hydrolase protein [Hygrophoropsis aurantiaca]|uniref:P-loop containing nucleoside triphosphate hydrolase protein n=1 Tax=Hygrophoropsis aurantiaca TaxID=72124 RepID=A0ACB8ACX9_9AGAM|nr:P-loop containing nucleoside triphosphate hydrolase protein [Hygrophoropsis aurantiaca]
MPTVFSRLSSHEDEKNLSYQNLDKARELAATLGYSSETTRKALEEACKDHCNSRTPYPWQVDAAEAFYLSMDCTIIAGTGSGKTLPFIMPSFINKNKITFVISPLKTLEEDHVQQFCKMGLRAVAVNEDTYNQVMHKELLELQYQVIYCSPEMALDNPRFNSLICSPAYSKQVQGWVIDEGHCISQWGGDFRPAYSKLDKLRSFVPLGIPIYVTSATMCPLVLAEIRKKLHINPATSFHLNLGNDRPNITQEARTIPNTTDFASLNFITKDVRTADDMPRTLVFVNTVMDTQLGWRHMLDILPVSLHHHVDFLHSRRTPRSKTEVLDQFRKGILKILFVTEIGGMGLDIPDIELVVQFGIPSSLTVWLQRAGRAGRAFWIQALAILLVEMSVVTPVGVGTIDDGGGSDVEDEERKELNYRKNNVDPALREWIETKGCRRDVADKHFDNPPNRTLPTGRCCDRCSPTVIVATSITALSEPNITEENPSDKLNSFGKRTMQTLTNPTPKHTQPSRRTHDHLKAVRSELLTWRIRKRRHDYPHSSFTAIAILPDAVLTTIASNRDLRTLDDLRGSVGESWALVNKYGEEVLALVARLDQEDSERRESAKRVKKEAALLTRQKIAEERRCATAGGKAGVKGKENTVNAFPGTSQFQVELSTFSSDPPLSPSKHRVNAITSMEPAAFATPPRFLFAPEIAFTPINSASPSQSFNTTPALRFEFVDPSLLVTPLNSHQSRCLKRSK